MKTLINHHIFFQKSILPGVGPHGGEHGSVLIIILKIMKNFYEKKKIVDYYEDKEITNWMMKYFDKSYHNIDNIWSTNWAYTILKMMGFVYHRSKI